MILTKHAIFNPQRHDYDIQIQCRQGFKRGMVIVEAGTNFEMLHYSAKQLILFIQLCDSKLELQGDCEQMDDTIEMAVQRMQSRFQSEDPRAISKVESC